MLAGGVHKEGSVLGNAGPGSDCSWVCACTAQQQQRRSARATRQLWYARRGVPTRGARWIEVKYRKK
jgi:hypothetical protein